MILIEVRSAMTAPLFVFTFSVLVTLSINVFCLSISERYTDEVAAAVSREYQLHACGRSIAAIKNLQAFAELAIRNRQLSKENSSATLALIEETLKRRYDGKFQLSVDNCIDKSTAKPAAHIYLKNQSRSSKRSPNYFYRFL